MMTMMAQTTISSIKPLRASIGTLVPLAHVGFVSLVVVPIGGNRAVFVFGVFRHTHRRLVHLNGSFDVMGQEYQFCEQSFGFVYLAISLGIFAAECVKVPRGPNVV
jgi:hypothetical protein